MDAMTQPSTEAGRAYMDRLFPAHYRSLGPDQEQGYQTVLDDILAIEVEAAAQPAPLVEALDKAAADELLTWSLHRGARWHVELTDGESVSQHDGDTWQDAIGGALEALRAAAQPATPAVEPSR